MYGQFVRERPERVDKEKIWDWLSRSDMKIGTEAYCVLNTGTSD